jgi:hypothetical protein
MSQPIDYSLMALRMILAGERNDATISLAVASAGLPAAEAEYLVATSKGRAQDLREQARGALAGGTSPFTAAQDIAVKNGLPPDVAEQLMASVLKDKPPARKRQGPGKLRQKSQDLKDLSVMIGPMASALLKRGERGKQHPPGA